MSSSVLVIDDSLTVRMDLKSAFEGGGYACALAASLAEGRAALLEARFNLIVLDVQLPDGDGVEFLAELKAALGYAVDSGNPAVAGGGCSCASAWTDDRRRRIRRQAV